MHDRFSVRTLNAMLLVTGVMSWIWVPWMIFFHLVVSSLSASVTCGDVLILRPRGMMLFLSESLVNCRCEWCLAFSVRIFFVMFECGGVVRGVGSLQRDAWEFSERAIVGFMLV